MKLTLHASLLAAATLLAVSTAAFADDTFRRTLSVNDSPDLFVSTGSGNVRISAGAGNQIEVIGHVHAGWGAFGDVRSRVQRIVDNPPVTQSGNTVRVGEVNDRSLFNNISIDYEVHVPANAAINAHSGSGDVEINGAGRFLAASSGSGNVRAHGVHGPAALDSGSGDLELDEAGSGDVKAKTGSGNVRIHNFEGTLYARSGSGDIEADGHLTGMSNVASGSGNVRLHLSQDSRFNLEASTGSGDIRVHMPGVSDTDSSKHHLTRAVNGGGAPLEIRTGSGNVEIMQK